MTETPQQPAEEPNAPAGEPEQAYEWKGADTTTGLPGEESGSSPRSSGREWIDQLQSMIDEIATQAAPVVRQIGAKAAELAAIAGEKAGPIAHRAADVTESAGIKLAERSRQLAEDLKREQAAGEAGSAVPTPPPSPPAGGVPTGQATDDESDGA